MIRIEIGRSGRAAIVTREPSWLARWLGAPPDVRIAVAVIAIDGGVLWCWDATSRRIDEPDVVAALERARRAVGP